MSIWNLRNRFKEIFRKRIENDCRYISIGTYIELGHSDHSFTNQQGDKVPYPRELTAWTDYAQPFIDLKEHKLVGWKPEFGSMHMRFDVDCGAQYRLYTDKGEWFCLLETWPPEGVVPCNTRVDGMGMQYVEFDVMEDGHVTGWPETPDFTSFIRFGEFVLIEEDKQWIAEQVDKKDTPEGNEDIKSIPYNTEIVVYDKDDKEIAYQKFGEFLSAMDFLRKQGKNPEAYFIHCRTFDGWNRDFWRECDPEFEDYSEDSFEDIEGWIEHEKVEYIKRRVVPDRMDLEIEEINAMCGNPDEGWKDAEDLPF